MVYIRPLKSSQFALISFVYFYTFNCSLTLKLNSAKTINFVTSPKNNSFHRKLFLLPSSTPNIIKTLSHESNPIRENDSLPITQANYLKIKIKGLGKKKTNISSSAFHDFIMKRKSKRESKNTRPSIIGSIFLYLIMVIVISVIFIILICFVQKWRENMALNTNFPKVEYSMLRQGEDEPEDPLGEILINIGLAAPEDVKSLSESELEENESSSTNISSFDRTSSLISLEKPLKMNNFATIPLQNDEVLHLIPKRRNEESDEEMLQ